MNKLWVIIKREYAQVVKKKSFVVGIVLLPVFMIVLTVVPSLLARKKPATSQQLAIVDLDGRKMGEKFAGKLERYKLDDSSLTYIVTDIYEIDPNDTTEYKAVRSRLDSALQSNKIKNYVVLFDDIVENDSCIVVAKSFSFRTADRFNWAITRVLTEERLLESNINMEVDSVLNLTHRTVFTQMAPGEKQRNFEVMYLGGLFFVLIIFGTVIGYGQILMRAVIEEKNSRIIEVMVSSVSPFQLMAGKIIGLGLASLTQVGIWVVIGLGIYQFRGNLSISADISDVLFNPILIFFFVVYLVLGYLLYSTIFALIGSIVNSEKESQGFIFPITMTVMLPIILSMYIIQEPNSLIATVLSLIPFMTPTMMVIRLNIMSPTNFTFADPIVLQSVIGVILTVLTILGVIWFTGRIFRVGILMYGKRPTLPEIIRWIKY